MALMWAAMKTSSEYETVATMQIVRSGRGERSATGDDHPPAEAFTKTGKVAAKRRQRPPPYRLHQRFGHPPCQREDHPADSTRPVATLQIKPESLVDLPPLPRAVDIPVDGRPDVIQPRARIDIEMMAERVYDARGELHVLEHEEAVGRVELHRLEN